MEKKSNSPKVSFGSLSYDILSIIFASLDHFDLARCSAVSKSWLKTKYHRQTEDSHVVCKGSSSSGGSLKRYLKELAMEQHEMSLRDGSVDIHQFDGHSARVNQCRMKMGLVLTGVGDKVARIWSLENYKCLEEYLVPDMAPLTDFDFDESKIVGLLGTRICIWRRHGRRSIFPSRDDTVTTGLCMRSLLLALPNWTPLCSTRLSQLKIHARKCTTKTAIYHPSTAT